VGIHGPHFGRQAPKCNHAPRCTSPLDEDAGSRQGGQVKIDGFLLCMLAAVALALVAPWLGASGGPLHLGTVTAIGIALVFFLHGAALSPEALKAGAANWRLHLLVHGSTFVLFPAIG
jgi:predicted Na+-dependent transporter